MAQKLAAVDGRKVHDGEELVGLEWSAGSELASHWFNEPGPWICENVGMARALRKWLARNPTGIPADLIVNMSGFVVEPIPGQLRMALGCQTVWDAIRPELQRRGATLIELNPQTP